MYDVILKTDDYGHTPKFVLSTRLTTPMQMLDVMDKLHQEQETDTEYTEMIRALHTAMEDSLWITIRQEFFKGVNDVIFELTITFEKQDECKIEDELYSERIAGTLLSGICNHFGWTDYNAPRLGGTHLTNNKYKDLLALYK